MSQHEHRPTIQHITSMLSPTWRERSNGDIEHKSMAKGTENGLHTELRVPVKSRDPAVTRPNFGASNCAHQNNVEASVRAQIWRI